MTQQEELHAEIDALRAAHKQALETIREAFRLTEAAFAQEMTFASAVVDINRITKAHIRGEP